MNALVTALHIHVSCLLDLCSIFCVDVAVNIAENWTVQRQQNYSFSSIACDQTIEQTLNRYIATFQL
jgi:hypothetical protein